MISVNAIAWDDTVLPFQLDRSDIRGRVAPVSSPGALSDPILGGVIAGHPFIPRNARTSRKVSSGASSGRKCPLATALPLTV